jgi:hypothetical protein
MFQFLRRWEIKHSLQLYSFNISTIHLDLLRMVHDFQLIADLYNWCPYENDGKTINKTGAIG